MKNKIYIKKSEEGNYKHYIYRFVNTPYDDKYENYINKLTPIAVIDEELEEENSSLFYEYVDTDVNGLYNPDIKVLETTDTISIYQEHRTSLYTYRVLSKTKLGELSSLSKPYTVPVVENAENISVVLEYCDDRNTQKPLWKTLKNINILEEFRLNKPYDLVVDKVTGLTSYDIYKDDATIRADNVRILKILNIFSIDNKDRLYRECKTFRCKNVLNDSGLESEYSNEYFNYDRFFINIDKVEVYKKEATEEGDGTLLKRFIRRGGSFMGEDGEIVEKVYRNQFLNIKDYCTFSKSYIYTVYLVDEKGNKSKPITKIF